MADLNFIRLTIDGKSFAIPGASGTQKGLMSAADYTKLSGIAEGAQVNVIEGVKVNGVALAIAAKIVDILITTGTTDGSLAVNGVDVAVKGLAALAYKAEVSEAELAAALKQKVNDVVSEAGANTAAIATLNGTGAGSVKATVDEAFRSFEEAVTDDNVVNSYKELIDWAKTHGEEAVEFANAISALQNITAGIGGEGEPATVAAAIAAAVNALNIGDYLKSADAEAAYVKKKTGYDLSKNDFTDALKVKLDGIATGATANTYSYDETTQTLTLTGFKQA